MIVNLLFGALTVVLVAITSWIPKITVLPFGIDPYLVSGMGWVRFIITVFPPLGLMLDAVIIVIGFKLSMIVLRWLRIIR